MKRLRSLKLRLRAGVWLAVLTIGIYAASFAFVRAADTKPEKKATKQAHKKLTGAELYAMHCNRCHEERYPTERTDAQWKTILMHMQVRAQLPGKDAKAILKYLQENN